MSHLPITHGSRNLLTIVLAISLFTTLIFAFTYPARGDDGPAGPTPPSVPTHDLAVIAAGEATKTAVDAEEYARQQAAIDTELRAEQLGTPNPKNLSNLPTLPPMSIATIEAETIERPSNGIDIIQSASSSWINRYHFSNMWWGTVGGNTVFLYAGSKLDSYGSNSPTTSAQSVILYANQGVTSDTEYLTPSNHGVLTFTSSEGTCLTVTASDGTKLKFDAVHRTWSCK